jgi:hypothetical protein
MLNSAIRTATDQDLASELYVYHRAPALIVGEILHPMNAIEDAAVREQAAKKYSCRKDVRFLSS